MLPFRAGKFFRDFPDFLHRLSGARELPQACSPLTGGSFSAPESRGARTASACSPFPGGEFFAEPQRGDSPSADGGNVPRPAAGAKRKGHLRFSFLFELLPFPCFLIRRRLPTCDRFEKEYGSRVTAACLSSPFRSSQTAYCYTYGQLYAGAAYANIIYCTIYRVGCDDPGAPYVNSYADA